MVSDDQVRLLRTKLMKMTQEAAAAAAGMSVRTARKWEQGPLPSSRTARSWRTRPNPFDGVWEKEVVPILERDKDGAVQATTLIELLVAKHPDDFQLGQVRTLQRRVQEWRAKNGPGKEVFFEQEHQPGKQASLDFTHASELQVTIGGQPFPHLLFEFVLCFSGWTWACLAYGETFEALVAGLQGALWALGGVPGEARSDNLSAATHELKKGGRSLTRRFGAVLDHYKLGSSRIMPGKANENGVVEQRHYRSKKALAEALVLRGSCDFDTVDEYTTFIRQVLGKHNAKIPEEVMARERAQLKALPSSPVPSYTKYDCKVRRWSTIRVGKRTYSVPSNLVDRMVEVRVHADIVEVLFRGKLIETMPRLRGGNEARVDYRHIIWSLVRKPGAFAGYRYREELFPTLTFRRAYDALRGSGTDRADVEYVRILHLAASTSQDDVERTLKAALDAGESPCFDLVRGRMTPERPTVPQVTILAPDLSVYDRLLQGGAL